MRKTFIPLGLGMLIAFGALLPTESYSQNAKSKSQNTEVKDSLVVNKKEEKNRNVMLNADAASGPRQVNIGLPFLGDILILENDIPVVYTFYPQIPTTIWKYDSSIGKIGLLSFAEGALTFGKVGFCVNSYDRDAGSKFKGYFQAYTNSFGSLVYSGSVSGPLGKKGWGYVVDVHETYDRGNGVKRMYTPWEDRAEIIKAGISKRYKNGSIRFLYKHAESTQQFSSTQPLLYQGNGKFTERPGFNLGTDSYVLANGESKVLDLNDPKFNKYIADAFYLNGEHKFNKGFNLTYSSMYMHSQAPFNVQFPISLMVTDPDQQAKAGTQFKFQGTNNVYTGSAQMVSSLNLEQTQINTSITRIELTKKIDNHSLRVGLTDQFFDNLGQKTDNGIYYQTVEANPKLLDMYMPVLANYGMNPKISDANGLLPVRGGDYLKTRTNKLAIYFSDDANLTPWLNVGIGGRIEKQDDKETHDQYANDFILGRPLLTNTFNNKWNHVAVGSFVAKVTKEFGFLGDVTYNDFYNRFYDYPSDQKDALGNPLTGAQTTVPLSTQIHVLNIGAGIYYNLGNKLSIVSKVTKITKDNISTSADVYNPANPNEKIHVYPLFYNISTIGWTTDIVSTPFKNFNIHYLLTVQNPQYKNYSVSGFGQTYSYDNNIIPGLSKVLMEIDPSYNLGDFRIWGSLRYFGKQYGNLTNAFYYAPWWENFAGVDYRLSRNVDFKLQVVNFLNQKGIKGTLQGADQITDASSYIGRTVNATAMRPRTVELTVNFKL